MLKGILDKMLGHSLDAFYHGCAAYDLEINDDAKFNKTYLLVNRGLNIHHSNRSNTLAYSL